MHFSPKAQLGSLTEANRDVKTLNLTQSPVNVSLEFIPDTEHTFSGSLIVTIISSASIDIDWASIAKQAVRQRAPTLCEHRATT